MSMNLNDATELLAYHAAHSKDAKAAVRANRAALRIEIAWSAVLAGDIDDLLDHVAAQEPYN